jgi:uncharacterized protein YdbL (DUF1318 family)
MKTPLLLTLTPAACLLFLSSCTPTIRLDTPQPVKIDVNMKVEVTTKNAEGQKTGKGLEANQEASPRLRQRTRITEVQSLKNDRIVGEGKDGLLKIQKLPADPAYQEYAKKIVDAENTDRGQIYQIEADGQNKPVSYIISEYARRLRESAFPGEWVEQENGTWTQR